MFKTKYDIIFETRNGDELHRTSKEVKGKENAVKTSLKFVYEKIDDFYEEHKEGTKQSEAMVLNQNKKCSFGVKTINGVKPKVLIHGELGQNWLKTAPQLIDTNNYLNIKHVIQSIHENETILVEL